MENGRMGQFMDDFEYQGKQFKSNCSGSEEPLKIFDLGNDKTGAVSLIHVSSSKYQYMINQSEEVLRKIVFWESDKWV